MAKKHSNINTTQLLDSENNHIYPIVYWEDVLIFENGTEEYKRFLNDAAKRNAVTSTIMTNIDGTQGEDVRAHIDDWIPTYGGLLKYIEKKSPVFYRNVLDLSYDDAKKSDKEKDLPTLKTLTSLEQTLTKKIDEIVNNTINNLGSASLLNVTDHTTIVADIKTTKQDKNVIDAQSLKKLNDNDYFGSKDGKDAVNLIKTAYTYDFRTGDKYQDCTVDVAKGTFKIPIIVGADGGDGKPGADGKSAYVHIRWSANSNGSEMVTNPSDSTNYMGICSTNASTAPSTPASYSWKFVKGNTGAKGDKGNDGKDGTGVNILGTVSSVSQLPTNGTKGDAYLIDGILYVYVGSGGDTAGGKWQNAGDIKGPKGDRGYTGSDGQDGKDAYVHIKWSANSNGSGMVDKPTGSTHYLGVCSTHSSSAPTSPTSYNWKYVKGDTGPRGDTGATGAKGDKGDNAYTHIKYSANANGSGMVDNPTASTIYMGVYSGTSSTAPTTIASYKWFKTQGPQGPQGKDGNNFDPDSHMTTIINNLNGKFVKIGTDESANSGTVKISGEVWATSGFYEKSDKRLKENIKSINEPLDKILSIPTVKFNFKDKDELKVGTIAQEVESIFPELVTEDERGIKAVDYSKLSIVAIAAIKELVNKVNDLEDKINKLT